MPRGAAQHAADVDPARSRRRESDQLALEKDRQGIGRVKVIWFRWLSIM
jgi:hypothetical protein